MKHTPAPWTVQGLISDTTGQKTYQIGAADEPRLAFALNAADAKLIAAAPELLQWAIEYTSNAKEGESGNEYAARMDVAFNNLRAAIAKAGGAA